MKKILALTLALIMALSMAACGGKTEPAETNQDTTEQASAPIAETPETQTANQQNQALKIAKAHLGMTPSSYRGLIEFLTSEGFKDEDAVNAADNCGADWKQNAVKSAENYLHTTHYSYQGLINILTFELYTEEEARYAADQMEMDWKQQAVRYANDLLKSGEYSESDLIAELESAEFTQEEIDFAMQKMGTEEGEKPAVSGEITLEQLMSYPESPEEDFVVFGDEETGRSIESYKGVDEIVVIPEKINGVPVTSIGAGVFSNDSPVRAVKIPDTVTLIKTGAFGLNTNLEVVVFGSGVKEVQEGVFQNCTNLRVLILNDGLEKVGALFAGGCKGLESVEVPASLTDIHPMTFKGNSQDFVIYGEAGSAAEQHAANRGLTFKVK